MPLSCFATAARSAIPIVPLSREALETWLSGAPQATRRWTEATGFAAAHGDICLLADAEGGLERVLLGLGGAAGPDEPVIWAFGGLPGRLPAGRYGIDEDAGFDDFTAAAIGWGLGAYRFDRYRKSGGKRPALVLPKAADATAVDSAIAATWLVRDLINTPASDMGPAELARAATDLAKAYKARVRVVSGANLSRDYPAVSAVGAGSPRAPRVVDIRWEGSGARNAAKVVLVGKGVCFDTGGLDIKPAAGMKFMKKDMGGAAQVLGLARMIMAAKLPLKLRVLVGAVENAVSGEAMRPLDVIRTRSGKTVEVGHTDAEGRLVLCDLLTDAAADKPDLIVDCATLTGAARVALGTDLPAMFTNDSAVAAALLEQGSRADDPLWRLPLWSPYRRQLESRVADLSNVGSAPQGGAITAALFLQEFVPDGIAWVHLDLMAWNDSSRPGRPEGGEAMGMRALYGLIANEISARR
ncbi:MAG: leucyl aminopeptidase family protein [Acetobacterales bacterium]